MMRNEIKVNKVIIHMPSPPTAEPLCIPICAKIVSLTYNKSVYGAYLNENIREFRYSLHREFPAKTAFKEH